MAEIIAFPKKRRKPLKEHYVFITIMAPWQGVNADAAANDLAGRVGAMVDPLLSFHGESCMVWGPAPEDENPA